MLRTTVALGLLALTVAVGCGPRYPVCQTDANCRRGEYCVVQRCQQCRHANDCASSQRCLEGRCEP